ncbi:MAG: EamA family transporter [Chloroflexi bacterium]|nr:EamA family transporter [Chloroflexota bacterium]
MPLFAIGLVAIAAVLHAGWNVLLKTSGDPLLTAVRLQAIGTVVLLPVAVVAWLAFGAPPLDGGGVAIALASGVLEAIYFFLLASAYRRGDLSLVYPLARGSAPLLAVLVGVFVLGERLATIAAIGVVGILVGIVLVARPWRALGVAGRAHRGAVGFALATGAMIAAYSAVDRVGVRILVPWQYGALLAVFATTILGTFVVAGRRMGWLTTPEPLFGAVTRGRGQQLLRDGAAGVLSLTAYLLILFAYSVAPLAAVAPLRESAIVLAAAWGSFRLGEAAGNREAGLRIGAAALVVIGAVLVALGESA